jgi:hypothetical protein
MEVLKDNPQALLGDKLPTSMNELSRDLRRKSRHVREDARQADLNNARAGAEMKRKGCSED